VGKKTAARLLIELKARLDLDLTVDLVAVSAAMGNGGGPWAEVRSALAGLGYGPDEIRSAMAGLPDDGSVEDLLKVALRQLAVAR
jgi:Holliday junction DNA helicase RuvA